MSFYYGITSPAALPKTRNKVKWEKFSGQDLINSGEHLETLESELRKSCYGVDVKTCTVMLKV